MPLVLVLANRFTAMKSSQNALTFLTAQYRAIYGRAYVKGLASAMVLTSAMVGTYAHAADITGGESWDAAKDFTDSVSGSDTQDILKQGYYNDINADKSGDTLRLESINLKGTMSIASGAHVIISDNGSGTGRDLYGWDTFTQTPDPDTATGSLENSGKFDVGRDGETESNAVSAQAHFHNIHLGAGSETGIRGITDADQAIEDYTTMAGGYGSGGTVTSDSGSVVHIKNNSQLLVAQGASGSFDGTVNIVPNKSGSNSFIRGEDSFDGTTFGSGTSASLEFGTNSTIKVKSTGGNANALGTAGIYAANVTFKGVIDVASGGTLQLDGDFLDTSKSANEANNHGTGYFQATNNAEITIGSGSKIVVGNGSYGVDNAATADINEAGETTLDLTQLRGGYLTGEGTLEVQGNAILTESVLEDFVNPPTASSSGGQVALNDGVLELRPDPTAATRPVDLGQYNFADYNGQGTPSANADILLQGTDNLIKGPNLALDQSIGAAGAKDNLSLEADKLTLGGDKTSNFGFKQALVHQEVNFEQLNNSTGNKRFMLYDDVIVNAVGNGQNDTALSSGDVVLYAGNVNSTPTPAKYQVVGGTVNHSGNFAVTHGSELIVGGAEDAATGAAGTSLHDAISTAIGHDATFTVTPIDDSDGYNGVDRFRIAEGTLTIKGNGSGATSTVDLSNLDSSRVDFENYAGKAKINVGTDYAAGSTEVSDARLVVNDTHLERMFNLTRGIRIKDNNKGSNVVLGQSGVLEIRDDPTSDTTYTSQVTPQASGDTRVQLDVSLLKDATAGTSDNNYIYFKNGGRIEADKLQLMQESTNPDTNSASPVLNIGQGTIAANDLQIRNKVASGDIVVSNGTVEVGSALSTADANTDLVLGDSGTSVASGGAHLNLGSVKYQSVADNTGLHNGTYEYVSGSATESGTINAKVVLNGQTKDDASLNVRVGKWTVGESGSIEFASGGHGTINIGMDASEVIDPSQPLTAELDMGQSLAVTDGNAFNVKDTGTASFTSFTVESGGASAIDGTISFNSGDLSVSGADFAGQGRINVGGVEADNDPATADNGTLAISKTNLDSLITDSDSDGQSGKILFRGDSNTLDLSSETNQVELGDYTLASVSDEAAELAAALNVVAGKHLDINGNNISIGKSLSTTGNTPVDVAVKATDLTLGGANGFDSSSSGLGVGELSAQNVTFVGDNDINGTPTGQDFNLRDTLHLTGDGATPASGGTSSGNVVVAEGGNYHVQDGGYTHSGNMSLAGGKVTVGDANSTAASLDLTQAGNLYDGTRGQTLSTIDVTNGTLELTGTQVENLLDVPNAQATDSGAGILVGSGSKVEIAGNTNLDLGNFATGTSAASDQIVFNNGGQVTVNGTLGLTNNGTADFGAGTVAVKEGLQLSGAANGNADFVVGQGTLRVNVSGTNKVLVAGDDSVSGGQTLVVGNGGTSAGPATLIFGAGGNANTDPLEVNTNLALNGSGANSATVTFRGDSAGTTYNTQSIKVSGDSNTLNIGNGSFNAELDATGLSLGDSSHLVVNKGAATVDKVTLGSGAQLNLNNESLTVDGSGSDLSSGTVSGTANIIVSGDTADLKMDADNLVSYVSGDKADVTLSSGADLYLTGSNIDLAELEFSNAAGSGDIQVIDDNTSGNNSVISGDALTIGDELFSGGELALDVHATDLTLGSTGYDSKGDTDGLGVGSLQAQNVTFVDRDNAGTPEAFHLRDELNLRAPLDKSQTPPVAGTGTITGNVVLAGGTTNGLNVLEGNFTQSGDITLASGSLTVGGDTATNDSVSLTMSGSLVLDNSSGANFINVQANAAGTEATLDLTQANVSGSGTGNVTTIKVGSTPAPAVATPATDSHLKLSAEDASELLSGDAIAVNLNATGDLTIGSGDVSLGTADLISGASAAAGQIAFNEGGVLNVDGLNLSGDTNLNIGAGTINANSFDLSNTTPNISDATIAGGTFTIANELSSTNTNIVLGDSTGTNAVNVTLGTFTPNPSHQTPPDTAVVADSLGGNPSTISSNVVVNASGTLTVQQGDWTINSGSGDLTVNSGGNLVIGVVNGSGNAYQVIDEATGSGTNVTAALNGNVLNLNDANVTVYSTGTANFNELNTSGGTAAGTTMNINGGVVNIANNVHLTDDDTIVISGSTGQMHFGEQAVSNITFDSGNNTAVIASGTFADAFKLVNGGTLKLDFTDNTEFNLDQVASLREQLIKDNTDGSFMDTATQGYLHLGGGLIGDIPGLSGGEVSYDDFFNSIGTKYEDLIVEIRSDELDSLVVKDVNGLGDGDTISNVMNANVGAIQLISGNQVEINNSTLAGAANNSGNFVSQADGSVGGAVIQSGGRLRLENGGNIADVNIGTNAQLVVNSGSTGVATNINSVSGDSGSRFENNDTTVVANGVTVGTFDNSATGTLTVTSGGLTTNEAGTNGSGGFINSGSVTIEAGDLTVNSGTFTNSGTVNVNSGNLVSNADNFTNGGTMTVSGDATVSGTTINLAAGSTTNVSGAGNFSGTDVTIAGTGNFGTSLDVTGTNVTFDSGANITTTTGNISATADNLTFNDGASIVANSGDLSFTATAGDISINNNTTFGGTNLTVEGQNVTLAGNHNFTGSGSFTATEATSGSVTVGAGNQNFDGGAHFSGTSVALQSGANVTSTTGPLEFTGNTITMAGGANANAGSGDVSITSTGTATQETGASLAGNNLTVSGTDIAFNGTNTFSGSGNFTGNNVTLGGNSSFGTGLDVNANNGTVTFDSGANITAATGNITATGTNVTFGNGSVVTATAGNVTATGDTINMSGAQITASGDLTFTANAGDITIDNSSKLSGTNITATGNNVTLAGNQTFAGSGTFTANDQTNGKVTVNAGNQSFANGATFSGTAIALNSGANVSSTSGNLTFSGGTITMDGGSANAGSGDVLMTSTGTVTQNAGSALGGTNLDLSGTDLVLNGSNVFTGSGDITGTNVTLGGGTSSFAQGVNVTATNDVTIGAATGTAAYTAGTSGSSGNVNAANIDFTGNSQLSGTWNFSGTTIDLAADAQVTGNADLNFNGTTTQASGSNLTAQTLNFNGAADLQGNINATTLNLSTGTNSLGGTVKVTTLNVASGASQTTLLGSGSDIGNLVAAQVDQGLSGNVVQFGTDDANFNGNTNAHIGALDLNGNTLYVDPAYGKKATLVSIDRGMAQATGRAGTVLDGDLVVGKNAAVSWGTYGSGESLAQDIQPYLDSNGSLQSGAGQVGSVLVLNSPMVVADGAHIVINGDNAVTSLDQAKQINQLSNNRTADLALSSNAVLMVKVGAVGATDDTATSAIHFDKLGAVITAESGSKVVLQGNYDVRTSIDLFTDNDASGSEGVELASGSSLEVTSENGLLTTLVPDGNVGKIQLQTSQQRIDRMFRNASAPVRQTLATYGDPNANITGSSAFLSDVLTKDTDGSAAEKAARLGMYGGAVQSALAVNDSLFDAMSLRSGIGGGAPGGSFASPDSSMQMWASPVYKHQENDGFDAADKSYGTDIDLYGLNMGAELKLARNLKVGALIGFGQGDADGNGLASGVSNDFDYYGLGIYGVTKLGPVTMLGDFSYTKVSSDVSTGTNNLGGLSGSMDTTSYSLGVTGQLDYEFNNINIRPHAGLRYQHVDMDDYGVKGDAGQVASYSADELKIFTIPVGVSFEKTLITSSGWKLKPAVDFTANWNFGDTDASGVVNWTGTNLNTSLSSDVVDPLTFGIKGGLEASKGNLSVGVSADYTGSANTSELGLQANFKFKF